MNNEVLSMCVLPDAKNIHTGAVEEGAKEQGTKEEGKRVKRVYGHILMKTGGCRPKRRVVSEEVTQVTQVTQLRPKDLPAVRAAILSLQDGRCFVCKERLLLANGQQKKGTCLDHQHKRKRADINGVDGQGCIRGVLCNACNVLDGKVFNAVYRFKRTKKDIPRLLRSLADYYEDGWYPIIHPTEKPKPKPVSKRQYNLLQKRIKEQNEARLNVRLCIPDYSKRLNKKLKDLFEHFGISPFAS